MALKTIKWDVTDRLRDEDSIMSFMKNAIDASDEDPMIIKTVLLVAEKAIKRWRIKPSADYTEFLSRFKRNKKRKRG